MKNQKGFTTVELIVSFTLTMVVMGFLFEILLSLKDLYVKTGALTELITKQTIISRKINAEFDSKIITNIVNCGDECITIFFSDGTNSELSIDRTKKIFKYGDYTTKLVSESEFGSTAILTDTIYDVSDENNNSFLQIIIPITHPLNKEQDYGLNILYQYDNRLVTLDDFEFDL